MSITAEMIELLESAPKFRASWVQGTQLRVRMRIEGEAVGHIVIDTRHRLQDCEADVEALKKTGHEAKVFYTVQNTAINAEHRNKGYGKALYEFAFRALSKKAKEPFYVGAYACHMGSGTSPDAKRVWQSLAKKYPSSGMVIYVE